MNCDPTAVQMQAVHLQREINQAITKHEIRVMKPSSSASLCPKTVQ